MKKIVLSLILSLSLSALFASGGGESKEEYDKAIALIMDSSKGTFQQAWIRTITYFANENELGVKIFTTGGSVSAMENQFMEVLQDSRIEGIVVATEDSLLADSLTLSANEAGKPLILWGSTVSNPEELAAISVLYPGTGGYRKAIDYGLEMVQENTGKLYPAFIVGSRDLTDSLDPRWNIFSKRLKAYDEIAQSIAIPADPQEDVTAAAVKKALIENKTINILFLSADYIETIKPYLISSGMWITKDDPVHTPIICFDGGKEAITYLQEGIVDAIGTRDLWKEADFAMGALLEAIDTDKGIVQQSFQVSGILLTRETITDFDKLVWIEDFRLPPPPEEVEKEKNRRKPSDK